MAMRSDANSMSDITQIASNPPNYPRNPAAVPREPLTLYVSRVPGTKDIILSTVKPLTENVTVEDVAACLYYLHFNLDPETLPSDEGLTRQLTEPLANSLSRKPLPESSPGPLNLSDISKEKSQLPNSLIPKAHSIRRKPVGGSVSCKSSENSGRGNQETLCQASQVHTRRPLGSRPPSCESISKSKLISTTLKNTDITFTANSCLNPQVSPGLPLPHSLTSKTNLSPNLGDAFSVTVVRRDPLSGAQWNIGIISGHPVVDEVQNGRSYTRREKKPYFEFTVGLTTPGYLHFREQNYNSSSIRDCKSGSSHPKLQKHNFSFERKVSMEGSSFWSRASVQRKRALSDLSDKYSATLGFRKHDQLREPQITHDSKESQVKGYAFISPWGGRCKFFTGCSGRSLWCQHTLPSPVSASDLGSHQQPVTISELRFDIPASSLFTALRSSHANSSHVENTSRYNLGHTRNNPVGSKETTHSQSPQTLLALKSALCLKFEKQIPRVLPTDAQKRRVIETENINGTFATVPQHDTAKDSHQAYLDLSVGREKAGGGSKGELAKMGKIIVHDEGLKMLDLVVCANMAIWWSVWDSESKCAGD